MSASSRACRADRDHRGGPTDRELRSRGRCRASSACRYWSIGRAGQAAGPGRARRGDGVPADHHVRSEASADHGRPNVELRDSRACSRSSSRRPAERRPERRPAARPRANASVTTLISASGRWVDEAAHHELDPSRRGWVVGGDDQDAHQAARAVSAATILAPEGALSHWRACSRIRRARMRRD